MSRIKTEGVHTGEFLLSEANGSRSRENIVVSAGAGKLAAGTVLALITAANALTATAVSGNTGNGIVGSTSVTVDAYSGVYTLKITEAVANGGKFEVADPLGDVIGEGQVGVAFNGPGFKFTLSDGSTDFVIGDSFKLSVAANLGEYLPYDDDGTDDGRRTASAILYGGVDAAETDAKAVGIVREAEVIERLLTGLDANAITDLKALGIIVRD